MAGVSFKMFNKSKEDSIVFDNGTQVEELLIKIDGGYTPSSDEVEALSRVTSIELSTLPNSIYLLTNLKELDLSDVPITSIDALEGLSNLQSLDLDCTPIISIDALKGLSNLQSLDLSWTNITSIKALEGLSNLQSLNLSETNITSIKALEGLSNLQSLNLSDTNITSIDALEGLSNLQSLNLSETNITSIKALEGLANLQYLDLSGTPITSIKALKGLSNLQSLDLGGTQITSIKALEGLTNLQTLDLSKTKINASGLENLKDLRQLKRLYLQLLHLTYIPRCLVDLNLPFSIDLPYLLTEDGIYLYGTTLSAQDINLFRQSHDFILAEGYGKHELNEAKVIFLGYGFAGKTHALERIMADGELLKPDTELPITQGIRISRKEIEIGGKSCLIRFWDFGGQKQMHAMHKYFMTDRTVYVIMINNRRDNPALDAKYWIHTVRSIAKDAPILLFENHWDNYNYDTLDTQRLNEEFNGENFSPIRLSVKNASKEEFNRGIQKIYDEVKELLKKFRVSEKSWNVHNYILQESRTRQIISKEDYVKVCEENGVPKEFEKELLEYFKSTGLCFSYFGKGSDHKVEDYMILQPEWLTNAIYMIINNGGKHANNGEIPINDISEYILTNEELLKDPGKCFCPDADYKGRVNYVLSIMRQFELSENLGKYKRTYNGIEFIPALCNSQTPESLYDIPKKYINCVEYEFSYDFLPDLVMHRIMVKCVCKPSLNLKPKDLWNKGMIIDAGGCKYTVDAGRGDNCIHINAYSNNSDSSFDTLTDIVTLISEVNEDEDLNLHPEVFVIAKDGEFKARISAKGINEFCNKKGKDFPDIPLFDTKGNYAFFNTYNLSRTTPEVHREEGGRGNTNIYHQHFAEGSKPTVVNQTGDHAQATM